MELAIIEGMEMPLTRRTININAIQADLRRTDLVTLDYANGSVTNLEAMFLAARFFINKSIEIINLKNNDIGDDGVKMLAESLKGQTSVKRIDFGGNPFGDTGVLALADLQTERPDIKVRGIDLSNEAVLQARERHHIQSLRKGNYAGSLYIGDLEEEILPESSWSTSVKKIRDTVTTSR